MSWLATVVVSTLSCMRNESTTQMLPIWEECNEWLKMTLTLQGQIYSRSLWCQISRHATLWPTVFELQAILRQASNHKITLDALCKNTPHICFTSVHKFQTLVDFALPTAILDLTVMLSALNVPKLPWTIQGQRHPIQVGSNLVPHKSSTGTPEFQISICFTQHQTCARNEPQWPWTLWGQSYPIYIC